MTANQAQTSSKATGECRLTRSNEMPQTKGPKLVIAISSTALFDMRESP